MIEVPTGCIGLIIGEKGKTLRQLQEDSGTKIKLVPQNGNVNVDHGLFLITGPPENREKAEVLIKQILVRFDGAKKYFVTFLVYWCSVSLLPLASWL